MLPNETCEIKEDRQNIDLSKSMSYSDAPAARSKRTKEHVAPGRSVAVQESSTPQESSQDELSLHDNSAEDLTSDVEESGSPEESSDEINLHNDSAKDAMSASPTNEAPLRNQLKT